MCTIDITKIFLTMPIALTESLALIRYRSPALSAVSMSIRVQIWSDIGLSGYFSKHCVQHATVERVGKMEFYDNAASNVVGLNNAHFSVDNCFIHLEWNVDGGDQG